MEGFIKRVWGKFGIDKIAFLVKGVFIVRFYSYEIRSNVFNDGMFTFDKKLIIVRLWYF